MKGCDCSELESSQFFSLSSFTSITVLHCPLGSPVLRFALQLRVYPRVVDGAFRVALCKAKWLHGLILAISLPALDADMLGLHVFLVLENQPAVLVPKGNSLVHTIVPGLQSLNCSLGSSAKHGCEVLLDALPFQLLVMPGIDDEIPLFGSVLLINVSVLAVWWGARVPIQVRAATQVRVAHVIG